MQTCLLPEELFFVTFEGLAASYVRSPLHSASACRVQELQASLQFFPALVLLSSLGTTADQTARLRVPACFVCNLYRVEVYSW